MTRRLSSLSLILKIQIYRSLDNVRYHENCLLALSQTIQTTKKSILDIHHKRYQRFITRDNTEHYDIFLEYLKTLQRSLYKQQSESLQFLQIRRQELQGLINHRKIIEKIKNNKYSKNQEIGT
ncbi:hypothetical protein C10C_0827 [Chlamydia serpentis]|uniref:Uncharacterized protein n=1 Tax=Chlamydia serpentis TaxID=1967782 RepID=A0A2R8FC05_9CHLA|nr:hypothetical protein [Chlamydia serpentis]SPN73969.1 hypothetical protein C10C_0827 [Chlamydia serpentis]